MSDKTAYERVLDRVGSLNDEEQLYGCDWDYVQRLINITKRQLKTLMEISDSPYVVQSLREKALDCMADCERIAESK